jgi:4-hydroxybenzoate polyprenyltransferase
MLAIQISIGALNDWVDWERDAGEKPAKPIPAGLASPGFALALATVMGALGVALSVLSGPAAGVAGAVALGLGAAYDLRLSRTRWSWLPLAAALPVVPIHAWLGATGSVSPGMLALVPAAVVAGAGLALANGLVDVERDARSGRPGVVVALGLERAWWLHVALLAGVAAFAVVVAPAVPAGAAGGPTNPPAIPLEALQTLRTWSVAGGLVALGLGAVALRAARPAVRERGWELEAVGVAGIGIGWLAGISANGLGA